MFDWTPNAEDPEVVAQVETLRAPRGTERHRKAQRLLAFGIGISKRKLEIAALPIAAGVRGARCLGGMLERRPSKQSAFVAISGSRARDPARLAALGAVEAIFRLNFGSSTQSLERDSAAVHAKVEIFPPEGKNALCRQDFVARRSDLARRCRVDTEMPRSTPSLLFAAREHAKAKQSSIGGDFDDLFTHGTQLVGVNEWVVLQHLGERLADRGMFEDTEGSDRLFVLRARYRSRHERREDAGDAYRSLGPYRPPPPRPGREEEGGRRPASRLRLATLTGGAQPAFFKLAATKSQLRSSSVKTLRKAARSLRRSM